MKKENTYTIIKLGPEIGRQIKARAALEGISMAELVRAAVMALYRMPPIAEIGLDIVEYGGAKPTRQRMPGEKLASDEKPAKKAPAKRAKKAAAT